MTESERLEIIRKIAENNNAEVSPSLANLIDELKAEKIAEEIVIEHGLIEATQEDVEDEIEELASFDDKAEEDDDYEHDENLCDMTAVSPTMKEIFGE